MSITTATISFRLPEDLLALIDERLKGTSLSRGDWARFAVMNQLSGEGYLLYDNVRQLTELIEQQSRQLSQLDKRLAYHLFIILTHIGNLSPDDAKVVIRDQLLREDK